MSLSPAILAISLPENPVFADNLQFQITGLLVVIFTLGVLAALVAMIGQIFIAFDKQRARVAASRPVPPEIPAATPGQGDIPAPVFAVIAAAVSTALGDRRFVIQGVQAADPRASLAWSAEGRRSIYASKNLR